MATVNYTLSQMVREYLFEDGNDNMSKFAKFLQFGIAGLRELHMDMSATLQVAIIDVDLNTLSAPLPNDYIQYTTIGICGRDGRLHSLGKLNSLALARKVNDCGLVQAPGGPNNESAFNFKFIGYGDGYANHVRNGELTGKFFGLGGGNNQNGYYRIDTQMGMIQLSSDSLSLPNIAGGDGSSTSQLPTQITLE